MQRKFLLFQLVLLLFTCVHVNAQDLRSSASISAKQARILATEQLPAVLQWMEPEDLSLYGFSSSDDFSRITVGRPFYLSSMEEVNLMKQENRSSLQIKSMILPLILDNTVRCFIYISYQDDQWKAVGIGSRQYAVKGGSMFNKIDNTASLIIALPQMNEEFIADNSTGVTLYKPIFHSNKEIVKESFSMNELMSLSAEAVEKAK